MSTANLEMERAEAALLQRLRDENESLGKRVEQYHYTVKTHKLQVGLMKEHIDSLIAENEQLIAVNRRVQGKSANRRKALRSLNSAYAFVSANLAISSSRRAFLVECIEGKDAIIGRLDTKIMAMQTKLAAYEEEED